MYSAEATVAATSRARHDVPVRASMAVPGSRSKWSLMCRSTSTECWSPDGGQEPAKTSNWFTRGWLELGTSTTRPSSVWLPSIRIPMSACLRMVTPATSL